nr:DUF4166 domain-containing protein [Pacificimonas pallii]
MNILLVGGSGMFGRRLAELLLGEPGVHLILAGRSLDRAEAACRRLRQKLPDTACTALAFDRDSASAADITAAGAGLLIDASGPFQDYTDPYRLARAAIAAGIDYIDLADARTFVTGIDALDGAAKAAGVFVRSGASTCPAITVAALADMTAGWRAVHHVRAGIAPSPRIRMGHSVIRAIAAQAGRSLPAPQGQCHALAGGWSDSVAIPGGAPLGPLSFARVDVPEYETLLQRWPGLQSVDFGVATRPAFAQFGLVLAARLVKARLLPGLEWLAVPMRIVANLFRFGDHRGGMLVTVQGEGANGAVLAASWHLIAPGDNGPYLPAIVAAATVRALLSGQRPRNGARDGGDLVTLADCAPWLQRFGIATAIRAEIRPATLYRRVLGTAYDRLPAPLQVMHQVDDVVMATGEAAVDGPANIVGHAIAWLFRLPGKRASVPLRVAITRNETGERWERHFGDHVMESHMQDDGPWLIERFGPLRFRMALTVKNARIHMPLSSWTVFHIPMPRFLVPRIKAHEHADDGRFNFHVDIALPIIGRLVRYRGWLIRDDM